MKKLSHLSALIIALCLLLVSQISFAQVPTISSFSPTSGPVGTTVTITGTGFNVTATNNIVYFGATRAVVSAASATSLTVTVPVGATAKPISVLNNISHLTGYSLNPFVITFILPKPAMLASDIAATVDFSANGPNDIKVADIDGDGKADVVEANGFANNFSVYRNTTTSGAFSASSLTVSGPYATGNAPVGVAVGDLDADGKPDVVIANITSGNILVFKNTSTPGNIAFAAAVNFAAGTGTTSVTIADLDGNGQPEIIVTNQTSNTVSVFRNVSDYNILDNTAFATRVDYPGNGNPQKVVASDLDGDGKLDLAFTNASTNTVSVMRNTISVPGTFTAGSFATAVNFITGANPTGLAAADFNGDGKNELIFTNSNANTVSIYRNTAASGTISIASFTTRIDLATGPGPRAVHVADLNGDGKPEILTANFNAGGATAVSLFLNTSTNLTIDATSASAKIDIPLTLGSPGTVAAGDLDGDGRADVLAGNDNKLSILRNLIPVPPPPIITSFTPSSGAVGTSVTISGFNFDPVAANNVVYFGAAKATVTAATTTSMTVTVPVHTNYQYLSETNLTTTLTGYSAAPFRVTFPTIGTLTLTNVLTKPLVSNSNPNSIYIKDLDADGKADVISANYGTATVSIFPNTSVSGTHSLGTRIDIVTGFLPASVTGGDLDGDGKPDLVVVDATGAAQSFHVLRNTSTAGSISFAPKVTTAIGSTNYNVLVADIDGDGKLDVSTINGGVMSVFRNTSTGPGIISFAPKLTIVVPSTAITTGDIDGDGMLDIIVSANASTLIHEVSVLRNTSSSGTISFAAAVTSNVDLGPYNIMIGDLDGDGKPDLATANLSGNTVSVLRNTSTVGSVSLAPKIDISTPQPAPAGELIAHSGVITDMDGDGKADIVVFSLYSATISILPNTSTSGTISFGAKKDFALGSFSASAVGDIDGNGRPDLVAAISNTLTVISNTDVTANVNLSALSGSSGTLSPVFAQATTAYTTTVGNATSSITVTPTVADATSTVKVNGTAVTSGSASGNIPLTVGANTITILVTGSDNVTTKTYTITVTRLNSQTITFAALSSKTYGDADLDPGATSSSALAVTYTSGNTAVATIVAGKIHIVGVGTAGISANQAGNGTFDVAPTVTQTITVSPATLTYTANAATKVYGTTNPVFSGTVTGFVNAETQAGVTTGALLFTSTAIAASVVGSYPVNGSGLTAANYTFVQAAANATAMTVTKAPLTITANAQTRAYGAANPALTVSYTGFINGDTGSSLTTPATVTTTATATSVPGTYPITASAAASANYTFSYTGGTLTVTKAPLTITADSKTKSYLTANPTLTVSYTGFANSETSTVLTTQASISTTATASSSPGTYPIVASGAAAANYTISYVDGVLTVTGAPTDITLTQSTTLYENQASGADAGTLSSVSTDPSATYTYTLVSGTGSTDNTLFSISGSAITTTAALDFETKASYSIRVRTTNQFGLFFEKQLTISVNDVNEAPTMDPVANQTICFTTVTQTITFTNVTVGPDAGQLRSIAWSSPSNLLTSLNVTLGSGNTATLTYSLADGAVGTIPILITVRDNGGTANGGVNALNRTFNIIVNPLPVATITSDLGTNVSKGFTAHLTASGGTTYSWATAAGIISGQNTAVLTVRPAVTTTYTVTATNGSGCTSVQSITLNVLADFRALSANNILTPNADGKNDVLAIANIDMYPNNTARIYDRGGRLLFTEVNYKNDWSGTLNGQPVNEDSYYYVIDFGPGYGYFKGFVSVVRDGK